MPDDLSRRRFVQLTAGGMGGLLLAACAQRAGWSGADARGGHGAAAGAPASSSRVTRAGLQLYTVRALIERDMADTLRRVAGVGYREVEFAGYFGRNPGSVRAMLDDAGLTAPSAHVGLDALHRDTTGAIAAAKVIGHRHLVVPWLQPPTDIDAWRRIAADFNRIGAELRQHGLQFAYHNHDFELRPIAGTVPYDLLLNECDPELVKMEMDIFWTVKGGGDPLSYFERFPGRFTMVHVKDMRDPRGAQEMTEVGAGSIDFSRIFAQSERAGLVHYFVEHDDPTDPLESIRTSYLNLRRLLS